MPLEHATLLPVSFPGKLVVKFWCKNRQYFTITSYLFAKNEKINKNDVFIYTFVLFIF